MSGRVVPRAPTEDGAVVAEPPLQEVGRLLADNRRRLRLDGRACGRPDWGDLQRRARQAAVEAAASTSAGAASLCRNGQRSSHSGRPSAGAVSSGRLGQELRPERPGPAARPHADQSHRGQRHAEDTALRCPPPPPWDRPTPTPFPSRSTAGRAKSPWEERAIVDPDLFAGFADRAGGGIAGLGFRRRCCRRSGRTCGARPGQRQPRPCWASASRRPAGPGNAAGAVTTWSCRSAPCAARSRSPSSPAICWPSCRDSTPSTTPASTTTAADTAFAAATIRCPTSRRRTTGWKRRSGAGAPARRGAADFSPGPSDRIELRVGGEMWPRPVGARPGRRLDGAGAAGLKVRSRALTNTLFARLFLSDLFIHGIGGGKYDELTDDIIRRFYECEPPDFLVLSATRLLPLPAVPVGVAGSSPPGAGTARRALEPAAPFAPGTRRRPAGDGGTKAGADRSGTADAAGRRERFRALAAATADCERRSPAAKGIAPGTGADGPGAGNERRAAPPRLRLLSLPGGVAAAFLHPIPMIR